jgi:hypothetical protein
LRHTPDAIVKGAGIFAVVVVALALATVARAGHEMSVYPSFYPHDIRIETIPPERAARLLGESHIQAYVGREPQVARERPESVQAVESLGSIVIVRVNPDSPVARDNASACTVARAVVREMAGRHSELIFHPYPVTPFHGDYLYHVDLADAAKKRLADSSAAASPPAHPNPKVRADDALAGSLVRPDWIARGAQWDAAVQAVSAAELLAASTTAINGWLGPPAAKTGWFHAARLLAGSADDPQVRERVQADLQLLEAGVQQAPVERINLERRLVRSLTSTCHAAVAGYTVKREYVSTEYFRGIENIGFDSIAGLNSAMFIRTVKLKDFPWNGWLSLGIDSSPAAAWNPIGGFTDGFGRLMWSALSDPAVLPSPNDSGWLLNRISDVQSKPDR